MTPTQAGALFLPKNPTDWKYVASPMREWVAA